MRDKLTALTKKWRKWSALDQQVEDKAAGDGSLMHGTRISCADELESILAEPDPQPQPQLKYPRPCGLCPGQIESAEDTEWHGLGNCVPICARCVGSGIEPSPDEIKESYDQHAVGIIKNLAMLIRRLCYKNSNTKLVTQSLNYLRGEGLQGSVLREAQPAAPTPSEPPMSQREAYQRGYAQAKRDLTTPAPTEPQLGTCDYNRTNHENWKPVEAPAAEPLTAERMLDMVRGSLETYPDGGGDIEVMRGVDKIVAIRTAALQAQVADLTQKLLCTHDETQYRAKLDDIVRLEAQVNALRETGSEVLNYAGMDAFLDDPESGALQTWAIRKEDLLDLRAALQPLPATEYVYCHECSKAGGADRPIHHLPPVCLPAEPPKGEL